MDLLFSFSFIFITLLFFHVPTSVLAMDDQYENCSTPFRCGNMDISYPFWGGDRSEYCGFPGFKVECNTDVPQITILDRTYRILDINKTSRRVTVARQDYWENNCPSNPGNSPLNFSLFQYTSATRNITLYYDCPLSSSNEIMAMFLPNRFYCNSEQTNPNTFNYFIFTNNGFTSASSTYLGSCRTNVQVSTAERNLLSSNLTEALHSGFELQWYANDSFCDTCVKSNGLCGHDIDTSEFTCYCLDQPEPLSCPSSRSEGNLSNFQEMKTYYYN